MKQLARSVAGGKASSIARRGLGLPSVKDATVKLIGRMIQAEIKSLCAYRFSSVYKDTSGEALQKFSIALAFEEIQQHAPVLTTALMESCPSKKREDEKKVAVVMCASLLLKFRNPRMKTLAAIFSLVLQAGHAGRQVKY